MPEFCGTLVQNKDQAHPLPVDAVYYVEGAMLVEE